MKYAIALLALVLVGTAEAATSGSLSVRVCSQTETAQTRYRVHARTEVVPRVFVNGRELKGRMVGKYSAQWSGYGVVAQLWQSPGVAPLRFRVASVRSDCANVRLNYVLH